MSNKQKNNKAPPALHEEGTKAPSVAAPAPAAAPAAAAPAASTPRRRIGLSGKSITVRVFFFFLFFSFSEIKKLITRNI
jgi:hypothetical protein